MIDDNLHIPPVLRNAEFVGMTRKGTLTTMLFASRDRSIRGDGYIRIEIVFSGKPKFLYTRFDFETNTTTHYEGEYGDPERDHSEVLGAPKRNG